MISPSSQVRERIAVHLTVLATIAILVAVTHGRSLRGEFVLDDTGAIRDNLSIRSLGSIGEVLWGGKFTTVAGRPLLNLSLAVNYGWGRLDPIGYHLVNYGIHVANALILYFLLRRLFETSVSTSALAVPLALTTSLLWCVHPLTINGVSYVVQRAESIASLFYLLGLWGFVKGVQTTQQRWFAVSVAAGWLGALSKETIATMPLLLIALDALLVTRDWRLAFRRHWRVFVAAMSCWVPLAICMVLSQNRERTVGYGRGITLAEHVQTQIWAIARYLKLIVWPDPLIFDYGALFVISDPQQVLVPACVVGVFFLSICWLLVRRSELAFPGLAMCLILVPSSAVPIVTQTVAEHRMYLASAFGVAGIVLVMFLALERGPGSFSGTAAAKQLGIVIGAAPLLLVLCHLTIQRTNILQTRLSIWSDTVRKQPTNQRALVGAAYALGMKNGDIQEAVTLCDRAIALRGPYSRHAFEVRGGLCLRLGQLEHAVAAFSEAIQLEPDFIDNRYERAAAFRDLGRYDDALRDLDLARRIDPKNLTTESLLGSIHVARGDFDQALDCFERVLAQEPNHVDARRQRATLYVKLNRWDEASQELRRLRAEGRRIDEQLVQEVERHLAHR